MKNDKNEDQRPASRVIADELRTRIDSGELPPGTQLPTERALADSYGAARNTAREALRLLAESGLVVAEHGRGTFVRRVRPLLRLGNDRYSSKYRGSGLSPFLTECANQGKFGRFEVLSVERVQPPPEVAERLNLPTETASVLRRENVFWADDDPVHRVTTYIPWSIAEGTALLHAEITHPYGIHGVLEDRQHVMATSVEDVGARMPTPEEIRHLRLRPGVPVIDVWHTSVDHDGRPYELTRFVMRADMTRLVYTTPVD